MEHTIELKFGYKDPKGKVHKDVTFGKRITLGDLILLDHNPQAESQTQREQLVRRIMITKFGDLVMPVSLSALNTLDTYDDDTLRTAADKYLQISRGERKGEWLPDNECRLMFGIDIDGVNYDIIKFGNRLTVADNVEADGRGLGNGIARACFQVCQQVSEIRNSESGIKIEGRLESDKLSGMDSEDFNIARIAGEFFRLEPAVTGRNVSKDGGAVGDASGEGDGVVGGGDTSDAAGPI